MGEPIAAPRCPHPTPVEQSPTHPNGDDAKKKRRTGARGGGKARRPSWRNPVLEEPHPGGNPIPKPTPSWRKPHSSLLLLLLATSGSRGTGHGSPECHRRAPGTASPGCDVWSPPHLLSPTCPQPPNLALGSLGPAPANLLSGCLSKPIKTNH